MWLPFTQLVVVQPYQNRKTAETVAGHTGAVVLDWPSFPGGKDTEGYIEWSTFPCSRSCTVFMPVK